jgi:hypothetical protein
MFFSAGYAVKFLSSFRPGREADHSPPSSAEVRNAWGLTYPSTLPYAFTTWDLVKHRDRVTFTFLCSLKSIPLGLWNGFFNVFPIVFDDNVVPHGAASQ